MSGASTIKGPGSPPLFLLSPPGRRADSGVSRLPCSRPRARRGSAATAVVALGVALQVACSGAASPSAQSAGAAPAAPAAPAAVSARSAETGAAASAAAAPAAPTAPPALVPVRVVHNAVAGSQALLQVIQEGGLFTAHGLAVEVSNASPRSATAALLSGEVPLMVSSGIHPVSAGLAGGDTVMIAGGISTLDSSIWTREVTDPAGLRGKRIGVSTPGDAADFAARYAARYWGLDPQRDLDMLQVGQPGERLTALQVGAVDATVIQPPLTVLARKSGLHQLAEMADLGLEYQHTGVVTTRGRLAADADLLGRFVAAWAEGVYYYAANPDVARPAVGRFMSLDDPEALVETYERYIHWYARPPYPTMRGLQTILDQLAEGGDERAASARPEDFVDTRFLDQLTTAGRFQSWEQQYLLSR